MLQNVQFRCYFETIVVDGPVSLQCACRSHGNDGSGRLLQHSGPHRSTDVHTGVLF